MTFHENPYNLRSKSNLNQLEGTPFTYRRRDPKAQSTNFFWKIANIDSPNRFLGSPSTNLVPPPSFPNHNLNVSPVNPMMGNNQSNPGDSTKKKTPHINHNGFRYIIKMHEGINQKHN